MKDTKSNVILLILDLFVGMLRLLFDSSFVAEVSDLRPGVGSRRSPLFHSELAQSGTPLDWRSPMNSLHFNVNSQIRNTFAGDEATVNRIDTR